MIDQFHQSNHDSNIVLQELVDYSITLAMPALVQPSKTVENATDYGATYTKARTIYIVPFSPNPTTTPHTPNHPHLTIHTPPIKQ